MLQPLFHALQRYVPCSVISRPVIVAWNSICTQRLLLALSAIAPDDHPGSVFIIQLDLWWLLGGTLTDMLKVSVGNFHLPVLCAIRVLIKGNNNILVYHVVC